MAPDKHVLATTDFASLGTHVASSGKYIELFDGSIVQWDINERQEETNMSKEKITPADEFGNCSYACGEEFNSTYGTVTKCDYPGTCDYKQNKGKTARKQVFVCGKVENWSSLL